MSRMLECRGVLITGSCEITFELKDKTYFVCYLDPRQKSAGTTKAGIFLDSKKKSRFINELTVIAEKTVKHLIQDKYLDRFEPADMKEAASLYIKSGGKRLRPAILLWSCGAVGGDVEKALPAAAAVEIFHTWTLVHDDIIDRDDRRRGNSTVHELFTKNANKSIPNISEEDKSHYGSSVAILAGDVQHGWGISLMSELAEENGVDPLLTLHLIDKLDNEVLNLLVEGELLDIQFSHIPLEEITTDDIENMLWKKTGALYKFCAEAGSLIGINRKELDNEYVKALASFSSLCGIAFQLQDDLLGVVGDPQKLGKPVGNDIREGKRTTIVKYAYEAANMVEKTLINRVLGDGQARKEDIENVIKILGDRGGIEKTKARSQFYIDKAVTELDKIPDSDYKDLLMSWAEFMISRND
jgi:geranylgeranyl diphosphate synthase, type I